jgi:hypothetical protein
MPPLLEYLALPNPDVDRITLQPGTNSLPIGTYEVEGVQPWNDFTLEKIMNCFGDILMRDIPSEDLYYPPPIPQHHLKVTDESCVETILKKHNHIIIDRALQLAHPQLEGRGLRLPISTSWGSLAHLQENPRLRPGWAGTIHSGHPPYENRLPGDTKQSAKRQDHSLLLRLDRCPYYCRDASGQEVQYTSISMGQTGFGVRPESPRHPI